MASLRLPHLPCWFAWRLPGLGGLLGLLLLAGCASLPMIVPDPAPRRGPAVQLQGARGPLSAQQTKAILDRLKGCNQDADIFDRHLAFEEAIVGSPVTTGNEVRLLQDGPATYGAMPAAIARARDHIDLETYILDDDEIGQRFAQALIDKQQQGVQVNLIHDSVGTIGTPAAFFKHLSDSGVHVLDFNPINPLLARKQRDLNGRDHRKLLIVDGRTAFLGGINISSVYSGGSSGKHWPPRPDGSLAWRDTHLQLRDLRTARGDPACKDGAGRWSLGHGRVDQPRLAQLPAQLRAERCGAGGGIRSPGARDVRERPRGFRRDRAGAVATPPDPSAPPGNVRAGPVGNAQSGTLSRARTPRADSP